MILFDYQNELERIKNDPDLEYFIKKTFLYVNSLLILYCKRLLKSALWIHYKRIIISTSYIAPSLMIFICALS